MRSILRGMLTATAVLTLSAVHAKPIGLIAPAKPLTMQRVQALPKTEQAAWTEYLARSERFQMQDRAALAAERSSEIKPPKPPASGKSEPTMPLNQAAHWYATEDALRVAENIVSYQTPAGGWGKNQPRNHPPRQKGQAYVADNHSNYLSADDFDAPQDENWSYVGTIDNDATITEIRFLAKVVAALPATQSLVYRSSLIRGLEYLLAAQFPNGGWPQVWPLQGGYHDAFTINDNAVVEVAEMMGEVANAKDGFASVPDSVRVAARASEQKAIQGLLATQQKIKGKPTLWGQQHDALTLAPTSARNYEPAALCSFESANILMYLMSLPSPTTQIRQAIEGGVSALRSLAVEGKVWRKVSEQEGRQLVNHPGAPKIWARYYDQTSLAPIFGDRDKSLHDDVADLSLERRNGYAWWGTGPQKALDAYAAWQKHGVPAPATPSQ